MIESLPIHLDGTNDYVCHDLVTDCADNQRLVVTYPGPGMSKPYWKDVDDFYIVAVYKVKPDSHEPDGEPTALKLIPGYPIGSYENWILDEAINTHVEATYALEYGREPFS